MPRTQMTHILEDSTHKIVGQPPKKGVSWVLGVFVMYILSISLYIYDYQRFCCSKPPPHSSPL